MPTNEHVYEAQVIRDTEYLNIVEAAMMQCAVEIHEEPATTHGHENRAHIALNIFLSTDEAARFARFFAWLALFNPAIRGQVFKAAETDKIRPDLIDGAALRTLIKNSWNTAANVPDPVE